MISAEVEASRSAGLRWTWEPEAHFCTAACRTAQLQPREIGAAARGSLHVWKDSGNVGSLKL